MAHVDWIPSYWQTDAGGYVSDKPSAIVVIETECTYKPAELHGYIRRALLRIGPSNTFELPKSAVVTCDPQQVTITFPLSDICHPNLATPYQLAHVLSDLDRIVSELLTRDDVALLKLLDLNRRADG